LNLLDYSWGLVTSIGQRDYESLKLLLEPDLTSPALTSDRKGMVLKIPIPKIGEKGFYTLHGLYFDQDEHSFSALWRLFRASLYHASLHAAYSDFKRYGSWARGKDLSATTFVVSLMEDFRITKKAASAWPGILSDLAFGNYISGLRAGDVERLSDPERFATKLLLNLWGVGSHAKGDETEDSEVRDSAAAIRSAVDEGVANGKEFGDRFFKAAEGAYSRLSSLGRLREIPYFPYTESHRESTIFENQVVEIEDAKTLEQSALSTLGLSLASLNSDGTALDEAKEFLQSMKDSEAKLARVKEEYEQLISTTRLESVEFPKGDYAGYLRVRASLSGPIKNIRDQLRQVKNALDETAGHESGQIDTQAAIQVVASGNLRTDVFVREEPMAKSEAWAFLIDASKSTSSFSHEVKGIGTCLAEVAHELMPVQGSWAMYAFNNSLQVIKHFEENFGNESKARLGGIQQRNVTLLPDALTVANRALSAKPVDTRILVVASDGYPTGYRGIEDALVDSIKQVSKSGTLLMGLGIDSHALEEYFTVNCVVNSPYQMMKSFVRSYLELSSMF
jgi:hypothetical protein